MKIKINRKILPIILLILTLFSVTQPIFAASGSGQWVGGQYASGYTTTESDNSGNGILIRRLINYTTGEKRTVFCSEHGVDFKTGVIYNGSYYTPTDTSIRNVCKIAYFGWYAKYGDYVVDGGIPTERKKDYAFTQQMIWETLGQSSATFTSSSVQSEYVAFKNSINNQIERMKLKPSFSDTTTTLNVGTNTLTDTNGVLADYTSINHTENGITFTHNKGENTMTISVSNSCTIENYRISDDMMKSWGLIKEDTKDNDTTIYFTFTSDAQEQLYALNYNDPVTISMDLKINLLGNIELTKLDSENNLIDGAIYNVSGEDYSRDVAVKGGKILIEGLRGGFYQIFEKSAPVRLLTRYKYLYNRSETK